MIFTTTAMSACLFAVSPCLQAAAPNRRESYEAKWAALDAWPKHKPITYRDIPWPPAAAAAAAAARGPGRLPGAQQHTIEELQLDPQQLRSLLFGGASGPDAMRLALRKELMRWHPDKFGARFGGTLAAGDKDAVLAGVQAVAQQLTALKQA
jgi:NF-kappa-B inhibitor-like protein 1